MIVQGYEVFYEQFQERNNYTKSLGVRPLHIDEVIKGDTPLQDMLKSNIMCGTVAQLIEAVMTGMVCVSNPSALDGWRGWNYKPTKQRDYAAAFRKMFISDGRTRPQTSPLDEELQKFTKFECILIKRMLRFKTKQNFEHVASLAKSKLAYDDSDYSEYPYGNCSIYKEACYIGAWAVTSIGAYETLIYSEDDVYSFRSDPIHFNCKNTHYISKKDEVSELKNNVKEVLKKYNVSDIWQIKEFMDIIRKYAG